MLSDIPVSAMGCNRFGMLVSHPTASPEAKMDETAFLPAGSELVAYVLGLWPKSPPGDVLHQLAGARVLKIAPSGEQSRENCLQCMPPHLSLRKLF